MKLFRRILLHMFGFLLMTLSVSIIIKTKQGAFPYDAISYYLSILIDHDFFTIGVSSIIFGLIWVILNFIVIKDVKVFWSLIIVFGFGYLMDLWFAFVLVHYNVSEMWLNGLVALGALFLLGFSLSIIISNKSLPLAPSEVFMVHIIKYTKKSWIAKIYIEMTLIVIALILATMAGNYEQISWFTFVSVVLVGPFITINQKFVGKFIKDY